MGKIEGFNVEDPSNLLDFKFRLRAHTANCYCVKVDRSGRYLATGAYSSAELFISLIKEEGVSIDIVLRS